VSGLLHTDCQGCGQPLPPQARGLGCRAKRLHRECAVVRRAWRLMLNGTLARERYGALRRAGVQPGMARLGASGEAMARAVLARARQ
jgi:hypothetical protein